MAVYLRLRDLYPESALLESSDYHTTQNAKSYVGIEPMASFRVDAGGVVSMNFPDGTGESVDTPRAAGVVDALRSFVESINIAGGTSPVCLALLPTMRLSISRKWLYLPERSALRQFPTYTTYFSAT